MGYMVSFRMLRDKLIIILCTGWVCVDSKYSQILKIQPKCLILVLFCLADGYISNTCVDIDYEAVKRKVLNNRKMDTSSLPPPPPDPPQISNMESNNRERYSLPC